jgi:hypothetical protein
MSEIKYKLAKKAYCVDATRIEDGFLRGNEEWVSWKSSVGAAKSELLKEIISDGFERLKNGDEITYLNIPVRRCKHHDLFEFEGENLSMRAISARIEKRERLACLDEMLLNDNVKYCYIRKGSYYRPGSYGYTDMRHRAGVFIKEEAVQSAKSCSELTLIVIDIEEHNKMIQAEIDDLKTRLL